MKNILWNIVLAFTWVIIRGRFTLVELAIGFALGYVAIVVAEPTRIPGVYGRNIVQFLRFLVFYAREVVLSSIRVAVDVVTPTLRAEPAIIAVELDEDDTDEEISLLANLLTMTPGMLSLEVSDDRRQLFVHVMFCEDIDQIRDNIKSRFERRVKEVLR